MYRPAPASIILTNRLFFTMKNVIKIEILNMIHTKAGLEYINHNRKFRHFQKRLIDNCLSKKLPLCIHYPKLSWRGVCPFLKTPMKNARL